MAKRAGLLVIGSVITCVGVAQETKEPQANQPAQQQSQRASSTQQNAQANAQQSGARQSSAASGTEQASKGPNPYAKADDAWISLSGTVGTVRPHSFMLNYGDGTILVEMDDGDRDADAYVLQQGDKVTVNGLIDDDFFEMKKIEASSVHVEKLGRSFFASALDEEDFHIVTYMPSGDGDPAAVHGLVTEVSGSEFTIDTGLREVRVDVDEMSYDPLDDEGYQKIEVGDVVRATGTVDDDFFESREIKASSVTTLVEELG
jgi:uncharacterized protein YdeI (BOF family)